jgi:hypothetical protein
VAVLGIRTRREYALDPGGTDVTYVRHRFHLRPDLRSITIETVLQEGWGLIAPVNTT